MDIKYHKGIFITTHFYITCFDDIKNNFLCFSYFCLQVKVNDTLLYVLETIFL